MGPFRAFYVCWFLFVFLVRKKNNEINNNINFTRRMMLFCQNQIIPYNQSMVPAALVADLNADMSA